MVDLQEGNTPADIVKSKDADMIILFGLEEEEREWSEGSEGERGGVAESERKREGGGDAGLETIQSNIRRTITKFFRNFRPKDISLVSNLPV